MTVRRLDGSSMGLKIMSLDVKTLCLGVLMRHEATGYQIRKEFESGVFSHFRAASLGAIYPALARLQEDGLVSVHAEAQDGKPDRKVYTITPTGQGAFARALMGPAGPDRVQSDHLFLLFFADLLSAERVEQLVDSLRAAYRAEVDRLETAAARGDLPESTGHAFVRGYGLEIYRAALAYLDREREAFLAALDDHPARRRAVGGD